MTLKHRNPAIGGAAAAAVLAVLLSACGKDVVMRGGAGSALPDEARLSAPIHTPAQLLPGFTRERANWTPTEDERNGPGAEHTDLVSVAERASVPANHVRMAAGLRPSFARTTAVYTRSAPYTLVRPDPAAFWQETALNIGTPQQNSRVTYHAASGVSQSSRGASGEVDDRVHAKVLWGIGGPQYHVELRHADRPATSGGSPGSLTHWSVDSQAPNQASGYFTRWSRTGAKNGALFRAAVPGGQLRLLARANVVGPSPRTDWLATGMWWYRASNGFDAAFGVFADGGAPFDINQLWTLTGEAYYTGRADGLLSYAEDTSGRPRTHNLFWTGRATLTANFGRGGGEGSISGSITGMRAGDAAHPLPGNPTIRLGSASLVAPGAGPGAFTGEANMTYAGANYDGDWGGQFFGNHGDPEPKRGGARVPTDAAGTFGVTAPVSGGNSSFVGTFQAQYAD